MESSFCWNEILCTAYYEHSNLIEATSVYLWKFLGARLAQSVEPEILIFRNFHPDAKS